MKKLVYLFCVAFFLVSSSNAFAKQTKGKNMSQILDSYLKIQESLANDSLEGVPTEVAKIVKLSTKKELKLSAQAMSYTSLEAVRGDFKLLSTAMDKWAKKAKPEGIDRLFCSMANAPWLQKKGKTRNPYYGTQMLECGEVQPW